MYLEVISSENEIIISIARWLGPLGLKERWRHNAHIKATIITRFLFLTLNYQVRTRAFVSGVIF